MLRRFVLSATLLAGVAACGELDSTPGGSCVVNGVSCRSVQDGDACRDISVQESVDVTYHDSKTCSELGF